MMCLPPGCFFGLGRADRQSVGLGSLRPLCRLFPFRWHCARICSFALFFSLLGSSSVQHGEC